LLTQLKNRARSAPKSLASGFYKTILVEHL